MSYLVLLDSIAIVAMPLFCKLAFLRMKGDRHTPRVSWTHCDVWASYPWHILLGEAQAICVSLQTLFLGNCLIKSSHFKSVSAQL